MGRQLVTIQVSDFLPLLQSNHNEQAYLAMSWLEVYQRTVLRRDFTLPSTFISFSPQPLISKHPEHMGTPCECPGRVV
jgi:hypothetical protein